MSSGAIMSAIYGRESERTECLEIIRLLEIKIERQQTALRRFYQKTEEYDYTIRYKSRRVDEVTVHMPVHYVSGKFTRYMDIDFNTSTRATKNNTIFEIEYEIKREISQTEQKLQDERYRLSSLESEIARLRVEYGNAVRSEQAAAEAAAAAAAQSAARSSRGRGR